MKELEITGKQKERLFPSFFYDFSAKGELKSLEKDTVLLMMLTLSQHFCHILLSWSLTSSLGCRIYFLCPLSSKDILFECFLLKDKTSATSSGKPQKYHLPDWVVSEQRRPFMWLFIDQCRQFCSYDYTPTYVCRYRVIAPKETFQQHAKWSL